MTRRPGRREVSGLFSSSLSSAGASATEGWNQWSKAAKEAGQQLEKEAQSIAKQAGQQLAEGARSGTLKPDEASGSTFTITSLGKTGGLFATPIINYPEVAILAAGRSRERVLTRDGVFYAGTVLPLSLSCDHRVVDGAEGARFLNTVTRLLQNPTTLLPQL